jgi:hypothetical protein
MPPKRLTVDEIVADANAARQALAEMERDLQEGIDAIDFKSFQAGRELTAKELDQRKKLRATLGEVRDGFRVLAFVTAQRLDDSAEAEQLARQMQIINAGLEDDLARLKKVAKFAEIAAQVADVLAKVVARLANIAEKGLAG